MRAEKSRRGRWRNREDYELPIGKRVGLQELLMNAIALRIRLRGDSLCDQAG